MVGKEGAKNLQGTEEKQRSREGPERNLRGARGQRRDGTGWISNVVLSSGTGQSADFVPCPAGAKKDKLSGSLKRMGGWTSVLLTGD